MKAATPPATDLRGTDLRGVYVAGCTWRGVRGGVYVVGVRGGTAAGCPERTFVERDTERATFDERGAERAAVFRV
ncbi:hypothetical protein SSP531S_20960 [Streptomyces spongiicola]|uniref:Uncharacterized protein n=1 Tax=Streptomyces spongiicola TaxID=1690221 RepID=A0A388SVL4_9ACTN|nr:hypothetical protein SSP531S_20960 [Streptomyces spongiicola]